MKGQSIETLRVGAPFTIVIGDTGIPAPTRESVSDVRKLWEPAIPHWEKIFDQPNGKADYKGVGDFARRALQVG